VTPPKIGTPCTVVLASPRRLSRSPESSVEMACLAASDNAPPLEPCTVRSRTRCIWFMAFCSAESVASSRPTPSEMLRACCAVAPMSCRASIALFAPVGESDGALMSFPEVICVWSLLTVARLRLSPWRLFIATVRWVMRIRSPAH